MRADRKRKVCNEDLKFLKETVVQKAQDLIVCILFNKVVNLANLPETLLLFPQSKNWSKQDNKNRTIG